MFLSCIYRMRADLLVLVMIIFYAGLPSSQPAFLQPVEAAQSPNADSSTEQAEDDDDPPLPKYDDMELPTVEQLVREPPVDWVVLRNRDVIVCEPVYPRPGTLEKMQAVLDEDLRKVPRPPTGDELDEWRARREEMRQLQLVLPDDQQQPEYQLHMRFVREIIYHEDMILRRVDQLTDDGKLRDAFELLFALAKRRPDWPGSGDRHHRLLFLEAERDWNNDDPHAALVRLEELHDRQPDYPELKAQLGHIAGRLIDEAVEADDFRRARHFLNRLERREPEHAVVKQWKENLSARAISLLNEARRASDAGRHDAAVVSVERAARIWPPTPGLQEAHRQFTTRFQQLKVGVLRLAGEPSAYVLPAEADWRQGRLAQGTLFTIDHIDERPRYRSRYFEQWEPTDLGRRTSFTLRQHRLSWESQPIVTASSIAATLAARLDPLSSDYDERFDSYVESVTVQSPFQFQVQFARVPPRTEALFNFPIVRPATSSSPPSPQGEEILSRRFEIHERDEHSLAWRRTLPESDDASQHHVAEVLELKMESHDKAIQSLLRGEVSMLPHIQSWAVERLRRDRRFSVQQYALPVTHVVQFNPANRALRNRELRRALAYAVDRPRLLQGTVLRDADSRLGRVVTGPFPSNSYAYNGLIHPREYDPALAASLVGAARKQLGDALTELKMVCAPDPIVEAAAAELVEQWSHIGIEVRLVTEPEGGDDASSGDWDLVYRTARMAEPLLELWPFLALDSRARVESLAHLPDWLRQELIDLDHAGDWNSAVAMLKQLHQHLWSEVQLIPLWEVDEFMAIRENIRGFPARPLHPYQGIEGWRVQSWYPTETP